MATRTPPPAPSTGNSDEEIVKDRSYIPPKRQALIKALNSQPSSSVQGGANTHELIQFENKYRYLKKLMSKGGQPQKSLVDSEIEGVELYVNQLRIHAVDCLGKAGYKLVGTSEWKTIRQACNAYVKDSIARHPQMNCKDALETAQDDLLKLLRFAIISYKEVEDIIDQMVEFEDKFSVT
ncbi:hypothetical protein ACFL6I_11365 [candidate division KSB1 bacterium]